MTISQWANLFRSSAKAEAKLRKAIKAQETAEEKQDQNAIEVAARQIKAAEKEVQRADGNVAKILEDKLNIKEEDADQLLE